MTKLPFGMVRRDRSRRLKWLDLHNLRGIGTAGWLLVVGLTGVSNTLDEPLYASWQKGEIAHLTSDYAGKPIPDHFGSIEQAVQEARRSEEHTSELQSLMRISYAVFCLKKKIATKQTDKCIKHTRVYTTISFQNLIQQLDLLN